jgi:hypothetical protein
VELEELRLKVEETVRQQYANNQDPDFDIMPVAFVVAPDDTLNICMLHGGHPSDLLPPMLKKLDATMFVLAVPGWIKSPDNQHRIGENVMFAVESKHHCEVWQAEVFRDPLPKLDPSIKMDKVSGRLTHLLCSALN